MHLLAILPVFLFLNGQSSAEVSVQCKGQYNAFANCQAATASSDGIHRTRRNQLRSAVDECFRPHKCARPVYGTDILPLKVKQAMKNEAWTTETLINSCRSFHDKQLNLINECSKSRTGKDAKDVRNMREKYYNRADYIFDAVAISKAKKACPLTELLIRMCVEKAFANMHNQECRSIDSQCMRHFTSDTCKGEYIHFNNDVCSCRKQVRGDKLSREAKTRLQNSPTPSLPDLTQNKLIASLLDKTGLATLFSAGLRLKRQVGAGSKLDLKQILSLFKNLQLPAKPLETKELETDFGLTAQEVNASLSACDSTSNPRRLQARLGTTPTKLLQLACDCDPNESSAVTRQACLSSPTCIGTMNYDLYVEAERLYKKMNTDHMRLICDCPDGGLRMFWRL